MGELVVNAILFTILGWMVAAIIGRKKVFAKAGEPEWAAFIPIYNLYIRFRIGGNASWWLLVSYLIPFTYFYGLWRGNRGVARAFDRGIGFALGLTFLGCVFWPRLGFGDDDFQGAPEYRLPLQRVLGPTFAAYSALPRQRDIDEAIQSRIREELELSTSNTDRGRTTRRSRDTGTGNRPSGNRPSGNRPSGNRPSGNRPSGNRPSGNRSSGNRPSGNRPSGNRPSRNPRRERHRDPR